jgi:hypothetical protein
MAGARITGGARARPDFNQASANNAGRGRGGGETDNTGESCLIVLRAR